MSPSAQAEMVTVESGGVVLVDTQKTDVGRPITPEPHARDRVDALAFCALGRRRRDAGDVRDAPLPHLEHECLEHGLIADVDHPVDDSDVADGYYAFWHPCSFYPGSR